MKTAVVFGGAGRIGLPFSVWLTDHYDKVYAIDKNESLVKLLNTGEYVPFKETGLKEKLKYLFQTTSTKRLSFVSNAANQKFDFFSDKPLAPLSVFIMVGTPLVDGKLDDTAIFDIARYLKENCNNNLTRMNIFLRSTVEIGTTDKLVEFFGDVCPRIIYWPERVQEGNVLAELSSLPQIYGIPEKHLKDPKFIIRDNRELFPEIIRDNRELFPSTFYNLVFGNGAKLTAREAEFAKAATNTARYLQFAVGNYFYFKAMNFGLDWNKILPAIKDNYPRLNSLSEPRPVGGPCLSKDWIVLADDNDMFVNSAHNYNTQFFYDEIVHIIYNKFSYIQWPTEMESLKVLIIGTAFKPNSDNMVGSNALGLIDTLEKHSINNYQLYDPFINKEKIFTNEELSEFDVFIIMTPHTELFNGNFSKRIMEYKNPNSIIININAAFMKKMNSSYFDKKVTQ